MASFARRAVSCPSYQAAAAPLPSPRLPRLTGLDAKNPLRAKDKLKLINHPTDTARSNHMSDGGAKQRQ